MKIWYKKNVHYYKESILYSFILNVFLPNFQRTPTGEEICWEYKTTYNPETEKHDTAEVCQDPFNNKLHMHPIINVVSFYKTFKNK